MDLQQAVDQFHAALRHCDNIVVVHRDHGGYGTRASSKGSISQPCNATLRTAVWRELAPTHDSAATLMARGISVSVMLARIEVTGTSRDE